MSLLQYEQARNVPVMSQHINFIKSFELFYVAIKNGMRD